MLINLLKNKFLLNIVYVRYNIFIVIFVYVDVKIIFVKFMLNGIYSFYCDNYGLWNLLKRSQKRYYMYYSVMYYKIIIY